jgi:RHS repeat-associated protein
LDYFGARYYSAPLGRFTSPDPLYIEARRLADPQQLNLYAYVRNNPLKLVDPTGMYIEFDCDTDANCAEALEMFNNRSGGQFRVGFKDNRLEILPESINGTLGNAEMALFDAINDIQTGGILQVRGNTGNASFGAFESPGVNSIDMGNLSKLDAAKGSVNSGDIVAHEGLEAFYSSSTGNFRDAHNNVLRNGFPGFTQSGYDYITNGGVLFGDRTQFNISGGRGSMNVFTRIITPIPEQSLRGLSPAARESIIENAPRRVEGVQFVQ